MTKTPKNQPKLKTMTHPKKTTENKRTKLAFGLIITSLLIVPTLSLTKKVRAQTQSQETQDQNQETQTQETQKTPPLTSSEEIEKQLKSSGGAAFKEGWNYFNLGETHKNCTIKTILYELQADGGAALKANSLWEKDGDDWIKYTISDSPNAKIDSAKTYAFYSNTNFYFDLSPDACTNTNTTSTNTNGGTNGGDKNSKDNQKALQREQQIQDLRAVKTAEPTSEESLLKKIASLPKDSWQSLWNFATGRKEPEKESGALDSSNGAAVVDKDLSVMGSSTFRDTTVTGILDVGMLAFDSLENSIGVKGASCYSEITGVVNSELCDAQTLYLQKGLAGNVDVFDGRIVMQPNGSVRAKKYSVSTVDDGVTGASAGRIVVGAGEKVVEVVVDAGVLTDDSMIMVTPEKPVAVGAVKTGDAVFEIELGEVLTEDLSVNWWVVN